MSSSTPFESIDWEEQWRLFSPHFQDGAVRLPLEPFGLPEEYLHLKPGPGFGDLSHPTTHLVLELLASQKRPYALIDIGCGSGILSVAAAKFGASPIFALDIDPDAISHTRENFEMNRVVGEVASTLPRGFPLEEPLVICLNMIPAEQKAAWASVERLHGRKAVLLTSGVLAEYESDYLKWSRSQGWEEERRAEREGWLAFQFQQMRHMRQTDP